MKKLKYILLAAGFLTLLDTYAQAPLTLRQSVETAMENSPDVRRARLNLIRSQELLNAALADQKSTFRLELTPYEFYRRREFFAFANQWFTNERTSYGGAFRVDQPILATDGTLSLVNSLQWQNATTTGETPNKAFTNNLYLSYNQPLFTYNRRKMQLGELETSLENAQINFTVQELNIERSVTQAFFDVYREMESLKISQDEYENQVDNYEIIKDKVEAGLSAREELFQAEVNVANSRSSLQNQQVILDNAKDDFKMLLGLDLYTDVDIIANIEAEFVDINMNFAIENGLEKRKEIRQREIDIMNAQNDLIETRATNEFRGDLGLTVGIFGEDESLPNIYDNPTQNPNINLTFTIPLYDWGAKKSRIKASEASIEIQELNMSDQRNDIIVNVRRSFRSLTNLKNQIEIAEQSVRNAQLTYDINQERYTNGDITGLDLNQYQNQLSQAKIDLISAKINYQLEMLNMKIQSLWDFQNNRSVLTENIDN